MSPNFLFVMIMNSFLPLLDKIRVLNKTWLLVTAKLSGGLFSKFGTAISAKMIKQQ